MPTKDELHGALTRLLEANFDNKSHGKQIMELHKHLKDSSADKPWLLTMLRHFDEHHAFLHPKYSKPSKFKSVKMEEDKQQNVVLSKYDTDLSGMPKLKGAAKRHKGNIAGTINAVKKPTK